MLNIEIENKLKFLKDFLGVFARDTLPKPNKYSYSLIANTDKYQDAGSHWIAIYVDELGCGTYFDSYGLPPLQVEFLKFLENYTKEFSYNKITLQCTDCVTCGEYACAYLILRTAGYDHDDFMKLFTLNTVSNDYIIKNLFNALES
jgi:hypothetical protein